MAKQVYSSVMSCDADIHTAMFGNVVMSGGMGMAQRQQCKDSKASSTKKTQKLGKKVRITIPAARGILSLLGGSVYAALPAFNKMWVTGDIKDDVNDLCIHKL